MQREILDWPGDLRPGSMEFWLEPHSGRLANPYTRQQQVIELPGARWRCAMSFDRLRTVRAARMDATLARLRGCVNLVRLFDPRRPAPQAQLPLGWGYDATTTFREGWPWEPGWGSHTFDDASRFREALAADGTCITVNGGPQSGASLSTRGWLPSRQVLAAGDYLGLGENRLHMVTAQVWSDAGGYAVLPLAPAILPGQAALDGLEVRFAAPTACFALDDDGQARNPTQWPWSGYTLSFTQSLEV